LINYQLRSFSGQSAMAGHFYFLTYESTRFSKDCAVGFHDVKNRHARLLRSGTNDKTTLTKLYGVAELEYE
jgi:hypothetical protein